MKITRFKTMPVSHIGLLAAFVPLVLCSPATAQTYGRSTARATVMVAPAQQKFTFAGHYQASLTLSCNGADQCIGDFPTAAANTEINISRISCYFPASPGSRYRYGEARLMGPGTGTSGPKPMWWLPVTFTSDDGINLINSGLGLQFAAGQYLHVTLRIIAASGRVGSSANCSIAGVQYQLS